MIGVTLIALSGCGTTSSQYVYKLYPGPKLSDSKIATLRFGEGVYDIEIDGFSVASRDYGSIEVLPGEHRIRWSKTFMVSVLINSSGFDEAEFDALVNLASGRIYSINGDRTTGHGYRMFLWIEDIETDEVIAGSKKL